MLIGRVKEQVINLCEMKYFVKKIFSGEVPGGL